MGISAAAIMGASIAPAWADAGTAKITAMFGPNGALDSSSLGGVHTGLAAAPGEDDGEEVRRKRPSSSDTDPLRSNRGVALPGESDLASPFTANLNLNGSPLNQQPTQNLPPAATDPPPANNNPPAASNPPPTNNPQNTIPIANNSTLNGIITSGVTTVMRRNGLLQ